MATFRAEIRETHPPFPPGSAAVALSHYEPNLKDIDYSAEDNNILENWIRETMGTTWHSMLAASLYRADFRGTCAMKPRGDGGVVDKHLNVYGTQRLKIAGISLRS